MTFSGLLYVGINEPSSISFYSFCGLKEIDVIDSKSVLRILIPKNKNNLILGNTIKTGGTVWRIKRMLKQLICICGVEMQTKIKYNHFIVKSEE
jgi:hypothetical protein